MRPDMRSGFNNNIVLILEISFCRNGGPEAFRRQKLQRQRLL